MTTAVPAAALPSRKLRFLLLTLAATVAVLYLLFVFLGMSPASFVVDFRFVLDLAQQMLPPHVSLLWTQKSIFLSLIDTVAMAFLGTIAGGALALFLAFLAATNTAPHPLVRLLARTLLVTNRSVPQLIVILVLLIAVDIGPFARLLTLIFGSVGMYGKFFADAIEQADKGTLESVESVGSTRLQTIRFAVLPQGDALVRRQSLLCLRLQPPRRHSPRSVRWRRHRLRAGLREWPTPLQRRARLHHPHRHNDQWHGTHLRLGAPRHSGATHARQITGSTPGRHKRKACPRRF